MIQKTKSKSIVLYNYIENIKLNKKKYSNLLVNILFIYIILIRYIIPYNSFPTAKTFYPFFLMLIGIKIFVFSFIDRKKILFLLLLFIFTFLSLSYNTLVNTITLVIFILLFENDLHINSKIKIYTISLSFIIYMLYLKPSSEDIGRFFINVPDPNFSSLFLLFLFYFSNKNKIFYKIFFSLFIIFVGVYFLKSRNFLFSIFIFYFIKIIKKNKIIEKMLGKMNIFLLFILSILVVSVISHIYVSNYEKYLNNKKIKINSRFIHLVDSSNYKRFYVNEFLLNNLKDENKLILFGYGDNYESYFKAKIGIIIHNSFLSIIAQSGVFYAFLYFYIIAHFLSKYYTYENYEFIYSYIFFASFLMTCLNSFNLFMFWLILNDHISNKYFNNRINLKLLK